MKNARLFQLAVLFFVIASFSCSQTVSRKTEMVGVPAVKNIIFMIGDGMGLPQINAARISSVSAAGELNIDKMPVVGLLKTHAVEQLITDSAAAGTALACGVKTYNGAIAMTPDRRKAQTILLAAQEKGLATGLVATSTVTHATPACFAAHIESRRKQAEIAPQFLENKVNLIFGGGRSYFIPQSAEGSTRKDDRDLIQEAKRNGYQVIETKEELQATTGEFVLGLFRLGALATQDPEPTIAEMAGAAITILQKDRDGFFLMVEGSQIDWRSHSNDADGTIRQMLLFDDAIKTAMDFAKKDGHTLVVITADHGTGGMTINGGGMDGTDLDIKWTTMGHTGMDIAIFAYGPGSEMFGGVYENSEVPQKMAKLLGIEEFPKIYDSQKN